MFSSIERSMISRKFKSLSGDQRAEPALLISSKKFQFFYADLCLELSETCNYIISSEFRQSRLGEMMNS